MERHDTGFTLIELLLTLAILAILVAVAAPSFHGVMARTQVRAADNSLVGAINFTRQRAVTAARRTVLCPTVDGARCTRGTHWEGGWLVALDEDADGQPDAAPIVVHGALRAGVVALSTAGRTHVRFRADGSAPGNNVSLVVCQRGDATTARKVVIANSGRPRQARADATQAAACAGA